MKKKLKKPFSLFVALCMIISLLPMAAFAAPELNPGEITAWKEATYNQGEDTVEITLHVQGEDIIQDIPKEKPVDVVLVVDNSGSMEEQFDDQAMCPGTEADIIHGGWLFGYWYYCSVCGRYRGWSLTGYFPPKGDCEGPMNKIAAARSAAYTLANELATSNENNRIAVVSFESSVFSDASIGLTALDSEDNLKNVMDTIKAMQANGGTNYTAALAQAQDYLNDSDREKYVIFISDGAPGQSGNSYHDPDWNGVKQAAALKQDGTTIYTIGLNVHGDALSRLATAGKDRSFTDLANLNQTLPALIKEIVEEIQQETLPAGKDITFVDSINTEKFTLVEGQSVPGLAFDYDSNKVTWTLAETNGEDQKVSFKVKPNDSSVYGKDILTNSSAAYEYTDYNGDVQGPKAVDSAKVTLPSSTLSYDLDGGTAQVGTTFNDVTARTGCTVTIPSESPEKTNQTFKYWEDKKSGTTYNPGDPVKLNSSLELTAVYTPAQASEDAYFYVLKPSVTDATVTEPQNFFYVGQGSIVDETADVTDFTNGVQEYISDLPDDTLIAIGAGDIADKVGENFSNVLWYRIKTDYGANSNGDDPVVGSDTTTRHVDGLLKPDAEHYTVLFAVKNADGSIKSIVHSATIPVETAIGEATVDAANTAALTAEDKNANEWTVTWKDAAGNAVSNIAGTSGTGGQILIFYADFAEKAATYTLTYDGNAQEGGTVSKVPEDHNDYPDETPVTLSTQVPTYVDASGKKVVFAGWSEDDYNEIFSKTSATVPTLTKTVTINGANAIVHAVWSYDENGNGVADAYEITIAPAGMTVYMGGDGYEGTVTNDENGSYVGSATENGFPEPGFTVTFPKNLENADITNLKLQYKGEDGSVVYQWGFESYDGTTTAVYRIVPEGDTQKRPIRLEFTKTTEDGEELVISDSTFNPSLNLNQTLTMKVYGEGIEEHLVSFVYNDQEYGISVGTSELTVRGTTDAVLFSNDTAEAGVTLPVLEADKDTSYKINGSNILVKDNEDGSNDVALLFDDIIDGNAAGANYTALLKEETDDAVGAVASGNIRNYEYKYLDLVDTANGNAWVTPSGAVTIKWPLPAGTNASTEFTLLHFVGVNRSMTPEEVTGELTAEDYQPTKVENVTIEGDYVVFQTNSFSPFVLTWDSKAPVTTVNVTFDAGDHGTLSGDSTTTVTKGEKLANNQIPTVSANTNYTFTGWTIKNGDGTVYTDLTALPITGDTTFVAQYQYHNPGSGYDHYVYYYPNYNGGSVRNEGFDTGDTVTVKENNWMDRDGYVFVCWNTEEDGSGTSYNPTETFKMPDHNVNLYAQWQKKASPDDTGVSDWLDVENHRLFLVGYPDDTFRPSKNMTRAEVAQMFYALLENQNVKITTTFSDVSEDAWYSTAVNTLASLGMLSGYPDGTFHPDAPITRAEFATVALAFAYEPEQASCNYSDVSTSAWYYRYVAQAASYGWIGGYLDNTFRPENNICRAEVTVIVNNMLGRAADKNFIDNNPDEIVHFEDLTDQHWAYYTIMEATNTHDYTGSYYNETWKS